MMMNGELAGFTIPRHGMGTMALAIEGRPDRDTAIRTIHAGLDAGVRYLDTAWSYYLPSEPGTGTAEDLGYGEKLVRDALTSWNGPRDEVLVATKTGYRRTMEVPAFVAPVSDSGESDKQGAGCGVQMSDSVLARPSRPLMARMRCVLMRDARKVSDCRPKAADPVGLPTPAPKP